MTDRTKKYFDTCGEEGCKTIAEWETWFNENGNHEEYGFQNFNDWFDYCVRRGDLVEVFNEIIHDYIDNETGELFDETIFIFQNDENDFAYYANITENNGSGSWEEIIAEGIEEVLETTVTDFFISLLEKRNADFEIHENEICFILGNHEITVSKTDTMKIVEYIDEINNR